MSYYFCYDTNEMNVSVQLASKALALEKGTKAFKAPVVGEKIDPSTHCYMVLGEDYDDAREGCPLLCDVLVAYHTKDPDVVVFKYEGNWNIVSFIHPEDSVRYLRRVFCFLKND